MGRLRMRSRRTSAYPWEFPLPPISDNIKRRMCIHGMDEATGAIMDDLRMRFIELAAKVEEVVPTSPERSSAIHHLDDALSDSVKALARHHDDVDPDASYQTLTERIAGNAA
jgi:hypothetical protein